ncbi:MAG: THUMP domain-containing class I SAM-dependent RNA methyltransferase [Eubacteriales bacterium]
MKALPWETWIGQNDIFPVKGRSLSSQLSSVPDCQKIIKKAVVERLKQKYHVSWFGETDTLYQIQFLIMKDQVSIMIDTSGAGLHKRGYRANSTDAPIKETLAAAMANLSRVRVNGNMVDPFCGSGTVLIESALYALNIAPGLRRNFSAENWNSN